MYQSWLAKAVENGNLHNRFFIEGKYDSCKVYLKQVERLGMPLMAYKQDSLTKTIYFSWFSATGNVQTLLGDVEAGLANLEKAYQFLREAERDSSMLNLYTIPWSQEAPVAFAANYSIRGDYENAILWQQRGLELTRKLFPGDPTEGNWYWNIGFFRSQQEDYQAALDNYKKAAAIFEKGYPPVFPSSCERIADACVKLGRYEEAQQWFDKGLKSAGALPDPTVDRTALLIGLAGLSMAQGNWNKAEAFLNQAQLGLESPDMPPFLLSEYYIQAAKLAESKREYEKAVGLLRSAMKNNQFRHVVKCYDGMSQSLGYVHNINLQNDIAALYSKAGKLDSALLMVQQTLKIYSIDSVSLNPLINPSISHLPHSTFLISTLALKARLLRGQYLRSGQPQYRHAALETYRLGISFIDKLNDELKWENSKFTLLDRAVSLYEEAISFLLERGERESLRAYTEEAWALADKFKAVILLEKLSALETPEFEGLPDSFQTERRTIQQEIAFLEHRITSLKNHSSDENTLSLTTYQNRLLIAKNRNDSLLATVNQQNSPFFKLRNLHQGLHLVKIQSRTLKKGTAIVESFTGDSTIYIFCITRDAIRCHRLRKSSGLLEEIGRFSHINQTDLHTDFNAFVKTSRYLYAQLIKPVFTDTEDFRQLIFIPDGPLGNLPFHLLLEKDPDAQTLAVQDWRSLPYLVKTKDIRWEFSAALLKQEGPKKEKKKFYTGFAPSFQGKSLATRKMDSLVLSGVFANWRGGGVPDLLYNRPEVAAVSSITGGQAFLAETATEQAFKQSAPGCGVLHLATHACIDDENPLYSQILFSTQPGDTTEDGSLHAYELYNFQLDADLAVLSACRTGAGKVQQGEGTLSLSRAFKYAGCPNIMMSLWDADDAVAKKIVVAFFENLKSGMGKDQALCKAQRDFLLNATQAEALPGLWANFVLIGNDQPVVFHSQKWLIALLTLAMSMLIVFAFFKYKKSPGVA